MEWFGLTDVGIKRDNNQDCFFTEVVEKVLLMVVCDGMGGAAGGQVASGLAVKEIFGYVMNNIDCEDRDSFIPLLEKALETANKSVCKMAAEDKSLAGMGTTVAAAIYDGCDYHCIWVGDSRIYALSDKGITQLSHDHSYVQSLVDNGSITEEDAKNHPNRNIITRAVGTDSEIKADVIRLSDKDTNGLLLCSDGLCGYVDEEDISAICRENEDSRSCAEKLVEKANENGGIDNVTVIVFRK